MGAVILSSETLQLFYLHQYFADIPIDTDAPASNLVRTGRIEILNIRKSPLAGLLFIQIIQQFFRSGQDDIGTAFF